MTFKEWWKDGKGQEYDELYAPADIAKWAWDSATKAEREACAKVCDAIADGPGIDMDGVRSADECALSIRERSNIQSERGER